MSDEQQKQATDHRCGAEIKEPPHFLHYRQCRRRAVDGPWQGVYLCAQHIKILDRRGRLAVYADRMLRNVEGHFRIEEPWVT